MYLRRMEVHGFKAFADRQRFEFGPGMTVIAGPNGSGKSNLLEAIALLRTCPNREGPP